MKRGMEKTTNLPTDETLTVNDKGVNCGSGIMVVAVVVVEVVVVLVVVVAVLLLTIAIAK